MRPSSSTRRYSSAGRLLIARMSSSPATVAETFRRYGIDRIIHGHTHRPAIHDGDIDGRACRRIVLGDWYEQGSVLRVDATGARLESL